MFRSSRDGSMGEKAGRRMPIRLATALVAALGMLLGPLALAASATTTPHATAPVMGTYVPVTPFRITDTRANSGQPNAGGTLAAGAMLNVQVTGLGTVPAGASAAVLNVTAVSPTASGFLTVFPAGITMPTVSNLNFTPGVVVANLVTVPLSSTGMVSIFNHAGSTNVVVDVDGYYTSTPSTNGSGLYNSMSPVRALGNLQLGAPIAANTSVPVTVTGALSATETVPATATAVVVNVTAAHGTAASYLTVYPAGVTPVPTASNVNFVAGQAVANRVTVGVGTSGQIEVYNHTGTVNVDVDVDGYYTGSGGTGSYFVPITPVRVADTRTASLVGTGTPIAANASASFNLATAASGIPANAAAVAANFTVVAGNSAGYLTVYPTSAATNPVASDLNWVANEIVPNFTIADTAGTGNVDVYNSHGATINLAIDVFGYFTASTAGPIMVSAAVTATSIAITYNEGVSCPTAASSDFAYYWTGSASGGTITANSCTTSGDVLTLTGAGFTLPGSTGGSIVYTAPAASSSSNAVYATSNATEFAATQTLAVTAAALPAMVSAYTTATTLVITYNEGVTCDPAGTVPAAFAYDYTGVASGFEGAPTVTAACAADVLTLTDAAGVEPPGTGANIVYTAPATNSSTASVSATGSVPALYAASQTLSAWSTPAITAAVVTPGASGSILVTYTTGDTMVCGTALQSEFVYSNGGSPAYPSVCTAHANNTLTLSSFMTTTTGAIAATLVLPGATDTLVYTSPAAPAVATEVHATNVFPQFPATQTFALGAAPVPAMVSAVVTAPSIAITYSEAVTCPVTGADADFVYYYQGVSSGGVATGCSTVGAVLTLTGAFAASTASASIIYTAPATSSTANAVYATGSLTDFAATQTLFPL